MNNKRYIDFVPTKAKKQVTPSVKAKPEVVVPKNVAPKRVVAKREIPQRKAPVRQAVAKSSKEPVLGVIEDLNTVTTSESSVSKSHFAEEKESIRAVKAKRVGLREAPVRAVNKPSGLSTKPKTNEKVYKTPRSPFINQDKVVKRPLSKNVYQKKVEVPKEEPKGPVTIITKPEKQAHVSLIVTIILTIILGAAAGTVAFLLLPK
ncbi:hypothetical protein J6V85_02430 [Candidatus Saccharibacteria bacterium]|nr:hypothetical protein [Candidatus Saccharibacteria bacterium]